MIDRVALGLLAAVLAAGCGSDAASECSQAEARVGQHVCEHRVSDATTWERLSVPVAAIDQVRTSKYIVPARDDARLPTLIMDVNSYSTHFQLLVDAFGERFAGLTLAEYVQLITHPQQREFFAGSITEYITAGGSRVFGYVVWDDQTGPDNATSCEQFATVLAALEQRFELGPLLAIPTDG